MLKYFPGRRSTIRVFLCIAKNDEYSPFAKSHIIGKLILLNWLRSHLIALGGSEIMVFLFSSVIFNGGQ